MSERYKTSFRGYLIDHHSPDPPIVTLTKLNIEAYERFYVEANINHLMVYCKDHWGNTYYDSKVGRRHPGLKEDWVARLKPILTKHRIEFNAYYSIEYDNEACTTHPEWRTLKADGTPLTCALETAPWKVACYETNYRGYLLEQLEEIVEGYQPDSLFLDIFGKSLCYCKVCRENFERDYGFPLPETEKGLVEHNNEVVESLNNSAKKMLEEILNLVKGIDPDIKVTFNFAALYNKDIRDQLDYQFTEPWAGNWLSAAYSRDTAVGQHPQLGPGDVSEVYNYQPESIYELAAAQIVAQGCRVFMFSGSQHPDGTLEHEEARRIGKAYQEVEKYESYLTNRQLIADIGIIQSDASAGILGEGSVPASAIARVRASNGHKEALLGAMKMCDYVNYTWQIVPEQTLDLKVMSHYKLLIVPELYCISALLAEALRKYVSQGGTVIIDGKSGLYNNAGQKLKHYVLEDLVGCRYINENTFYDKSDWGSYLDLVEEKLWHCIPDTFPPVGPTRQLVEQQQGKVLARFMNPATELTSKKWVNWWCPPPSIKTDEPAIIENEIGKGKVLFCAFDFFKLENKGFKLAKEMFKGMVGHFITTPSIKLLTPYPNSISFVAYERQADKQLILHVVSNIPEKTQGDCPIISPGVLEISKLKWQIMDASCAYPLEETLAIEDHQDSVTIQLPDIRIHQVIIINFDGRE